MIIETNTDNHFTARADVKQLVEGTLEDQLGHHPARLTRVEVQTGDVNGDKGGDSDIQCSMEARPEGHQPVGVVHKAGTIEDAVDGATGKLRRSLDHLIGRLNDR